MKISTPLNEFTRYEYGTTDYEFLKNTLRFHNAFASREQYNVLGVRLLGQCLWIKCVLVQ